ncbi:MAG: type I restriction-modification enzyme R subunit C-terminal domain-containing protein, partial [Pseudomonadota bacterium]
WNTLSDEKRDELLNQVAGLPTERPSDKEEAKRFDLLMFSLELTVLKASPSFERLRKQLIEIASALEEQTAIPAIAAQAELIQEIQTEDWWTGVTVPILELTRRRLRDLVQHIDKKKKKIVYSNFEDEIGPGSTIDLPQAGDVDYRRFKRKARHFLLDQEEDLVLQKLRRGKPLTGTDISHLQTLLRNAGVGEEEQLEHAADLHNGLGRFIRSLVGLERSAVAEAFSEFTAGSGATADQIEFVGLIVEHLTEKGVMEPEILYESPFTDIAPSGLENVFSIQQADKLFEVIKDFNESAVG